LVELLKRRRWYAMQAYCVEVATTLYQTASISLLIYILLPSTAGIEVEMFFEERKKYCSV
jgi:hypothetical protein